jgi:thiamine-phosphate pyrophosphorylase
MIESLKLCLITNLTTQTIPQYIELVKEAIRGGVTMVQLRNKNEDFVNTEDLALALKEALMPLKIPLIINDNVELALKINADGVHVGNQDMNAQKARELLGPDKIIGISIESMEDLDAANRLVGNYYVAASAVFPSNSKNNCKKIWGLDGLQQIVKNSAHPVMAIGNINQSNIESVMKHGAVGAAVISAIHDNPEVALELKNLIEKNLVHDIKVNNRLFKVNQRLASS